MSDRATELSELAVEVAAREGVTDAWTAKSFTDRLFVVEVPVDGDLSKAVRETLHAHDLWEANEVYEVEGAADADYAGELSDGRRYRFVDVRSRGELQSYVVE
ncbi:MAG: hypothetical protein ABEJ26_12535 [Halosimplex sp.]